MLELSHHAADVDGPVTICAGFYINRGDAAASVKDEIGGIGIAVQEHPASRG